MKARGAPWLVLLLLPGCGGELDPRSAGAHAGACVDCHAEQARAHITPRHAEAGRTEAFVALRARAEDQLPGQGELCDGCHRPAEERGGDAGLDCLTCHAAVASTGVGTGAPVLDLAGPVLGGPEAGEVGAPHDLATGALLSRSELCGSCHEVAAPLGFSEHLFSDWEATDSGQGCADCHLLPPDALGPALALEATAEGAVLREVAGGHGAPAGLSALELVALEAWRGEELLERVELGAELRRAGARTWDPLAADEVLERALAAGESLSLEVPGADEVCLVRQERHPELSALLDLPEAPVEVLACVVPGS